MIATIAHVAQLACIMLALGGGALATLAGAVMAAVITDTDNAFRLPAHVVGGMVATLGLIAFVAALLALLQIVG